MKCPSDIGGAEYERAKRLRDGSLTGPGLSRREVTGQKSMPGIQAGGPWELDNGQPQMDPKDRRTATNRRSMGALEKTLAGYGAV